VDLGRRRWVGQDQLAFPAKLLFELLQLGPGASASITNLNERAGRRRTLSSTAPTLANGLKPGSPIPTNPTVAASANQPDGSESPKETSKRWGETMRARRVASASSVAFTIIQHLVSAFFLSAFPGRSWIKFSVGVGFSRCGLLSVLPSSCRKANRVQFQLVSGAGAPAFKGRAR